MLKNKFWGILTGVTAAAAVLGSAYTVYASTTITNLGVRVVSNYDSEEGAVLEPTVTVSGSGFDTEDVSWSKAVDKWNPGSRVTGTIYLTPQEGWNFFTSYSTNSSNAGYKRISISGADLVSAKRDNEDGSLTIKFNYYPVIQLGVTEKAGWSDATKTKAVWKKVPYATAYQLRLYTGDDSYERTLTLEGTSVDLSQYITKEANYFYEVRATSKDSSDSKYRKSGEYVTSTDNFIENLGEVGGRWQTFNEGAKYTDEQGIQAANGWRYILGFWYYFDENGYAATGWRNIDGKWYYMNAEYKMLTGWLNIGDNWYYTDTSGAMVIGWYQTSPNDRYYFYEDGRMAVSTVIDGYVLNESGKMQ